MQCKGLQVSSAESPGTAGTSSGRSSRVGNDTINLLGRYVYREDMQLGQGAFGSVFKGLDTVENRNVAIKLFDGNYDDGTDEEETLALFRDAVAIMKLVTSHEFTNEKDDTMFSRQVSCNNSLLPGFLTQGLRPKDAASLMACVRSLNLVSCMVGLLEFSCDDEGDPGVDPATGTMYMILELGAESLRERLDWYSTHNRKLAADDRRAMLWCLVCTIWSLHTVGFVHLDIKPENAMLFQSANGHGRWKLIDLDGVVLAGSVMHADSCICSPFYLPPEIARLHVRDGADTQSLASRRMDVWSAGLVALETVFLSPVLKPYYEEWARETGSNEKFFRWLADESAEAIVSGDMKEYIDSIEPLFCDLLSGMLVRDPAKRCTITDCLTHPYFKSIAGNPTERMGGLLHRVMGVSAEERESMEAAMDNRHRPAGSDDPDIDDSDIDDSPLVVETRLTSRDSGSRRLAQSRTAVVAKTCVVM